MKITAFNPFILTSQAESVIALFEALGFEKRHTIRNYDDRDITIVNMKNADGFRIDVASVPNLEHDQTMIRMNVREFGEAYEILTDHGFQNIKYNEEAVFTRKAKWSIMIAPSGFALDLCHHIHDII